MKFLSVLCEKSTWTKILESWIDGRFNYFRAKSAMSPITGKSEVPNKR